GDRYEAHADAVADLVVHGASAELLLDELAPGRGVRGASHAVQRQDRGAAGGRAGKTGSHSLVPHKGEPWQVFAASGKPYIVEPRGAQLGAWVVRDWIRAAPDLIQSGKI